MKRGNILEGEKERKGKETFWKEKQKGKERKEQEKGKEEKKLAGGLTVMRWVVGNSLSAILGAWLIGVLLVE